MNIAKVVVLLGSFFGRTSLGSLMLAVFLLSQEITKSYSVAGFMIGAVTFGIGLGRLIQGRLVDEFGPRRVLISFTTVHFFLICIYSNKYAVLIDSKTIYVLAALVGITSPATSPIARYLFSLISHRANMRYMHVIESTNNEVAFLIGPLLGILIYRNFPNPTAILILGSFNTLGGLILGISFASKKWVKIANENQVDFFKAIKPFLLFGFMGGIAGGLVEVAVPALAINAQKIHLTNWLFASWAFGAIVGGSLASIFEKYFAVRLRFIIGVYLLALSAFLLSFTNFFLLIYLILFIHGIPSVIVWASNYAMSDSVIIESRKSEKYALIIAISTMGGAFGSATGGQLLDNYGTSVVFICAGTVFLILASLASFQKTKI